MPRVIDAQLGQVTVGIWDLAWSLVAYLNLTQFGIASSLSRYVANYRSEGNAHGLRVAVSTVMCIQAVLALFILALVIGGYYAIPVYFVHQVAGQARTAQLTFLFLGLSIAFQFLCDTSRGVLTGSHRWDIYNGLYSGTQVVCSLTMIACVLAGQGLVTISIVYLIAIVFENTTRAIIAVRICPEARLKFAYVSIEFAREIFMFGVKAFIMNVAPVIVIQSVSVMIASSLGPAALAVFSRPNALIRFIQTFVTRFAFVLTPMAGPILMKEGKPALRSFALECTRYSFAFTFPIMSLFCFYGDEVVRVWMGNNYVNSNVVVLLGLGFMLPLSQSPLVRILIGLNLHGRAASIAVFTALALLAAGTAVIFTIGPSLSGFAALIGFTMFFGNGILIPAYSCKVLEIPLFEYVRQVFVPVLLLAAPPLAGVYGIDAIMHFRGFMAVIPCAGYSLVVAVLYWLWLLPDAHKLVLRQKIGLAT